MLAELPRNSVSRAKWGPCVKQWHPDPFSVDWPPVSCLVPVATWPLFLCSVPCLLLLSFLAVNLPFPIVTLLTHRHPYSPTQLS